MGTARTGWVRLVLSVATLSAAVAGSASAATAVTIGNTASAGLFCPGGYVAFDPTVGAGAVSYVVPPGRWNITSWSTGASAGSIALTVVRPTATPGTYTVVAMSQAQSVAGVRGTKTFDLGTTADPVIAVQGGDVVGGWFPGTLDGCSFGSGASVLYEQLGARPEPGDSLSLSVGSAVELNISATLVPALPTTKADCRNGDWQTFGVFENQGDCVSYVATGGRNLPALGG